MRAYAAVTDGDWYRYLRARPDVDEVNFWQPSGGRTFHAIQPGEPFLFKLHYPDNAIVGGATYVWSTSFPVSITWEAFAEKNGASTLAEMRVRIERYRKMPSSPNDDYVVGCLILGILSSSMKPTGSPPLPTGSRTSSRARRTTWNP
jgi:putative restriction endonuclease